jgi:NTP pyrophosphatase (non-canonical NTP hydrolase)
MDLNELRDAIYEDAVAHGLYDDPQFARNHPFGFMHLCRNLGLRIKEEIEELLSATLCANFEHFKEELADIIIICLSVAGYLGIDIDAVVKRKMEINKERPWKHGKE